jgi:hypothetical protein
VHDLRAFGAHTPEGRGKSRGRRGRECRAVLQTRPIRRAFPYGCIGASKPRALAWLPRARAQNNNPSPPETKRARAEPCARARHPGRSPRLGECTARRRPGGPKQIWATWRAIGGGLACNRGRARSTLYLEGPAVVVQKAARGAVPQVHH